MADYYAAYRRLAEIIDDPGDGGDLQAVAGRELHRRQHPRAACPQGLFRDRLAAGCRAATPTGTVFCPPWRDRVLEAAHRRPRNERHRRSHAGDDRRVPRRHLRAARRRGISRRAGDNGRAHAAGRQLAEQRGEREELIVAALLHDIGHFTSEFGTFSMEDTEDRFHEEAGARRAGAGSSRPSSSTACATTLRPSAICAPPIRDISDSCQRPRCIP